MKPNNILEEEMVITRESDLSHDFIFLIDLEGYILSWNETAQKITGYPEKEIIGQHISKFYPDDEKQKKSSTYALEKAIKNGFYESIGWRRKKDGEQYRASEIITHLTGENLKNRLLVITRELSKYKEAEDLAKGWKFIFENSDWAFAITNPSNNTFEMVNPAFSKMYGYAEGELKNKSIEKLVSEDERENLFKNINLLQKKGRNIYESVHLRKNGTTFPVIVDATALKDAAGKITHRLVNVRDVSELKEIQKFSYLNEEKFRHLFDQASDGIFIADLNGRYTNVNDAGCKMLGYTKEELIGKTIVDLIPPTEINRLEKSKELLLKPGHIQIEEWNLKKKDGTFLPVEISAKILPNGEWQAFVRDISERKKTQEVLIQSEQKFRGLLEISHDAIVIVNKHGIIEFVNNQFTSKFGYKASEIIGKPVETLIPERFGMKHIVERMKYMTSPVARTMGLGSNLLAKRKDGSEFPVDISLVPFVMTTGMVYTAFIRDLSDRSRFDAQQRFLAETGRVLSENIDFDQRLVNLTHLCVPFLSDFCILYLCDRKKFVLKAVLHREKTQEKLLNEIASHLFSKSEISPFMYHGKTTLLKPLFIEKVTDSFLQSITYEEKYFNDFKELNPSSLLFVPLISGGKIIGAMVFGMSTSERKFSEEDIVFTSTIGYRVGLSIDNVTLFLEAQRATKAREDILSIVSHDLRNPLSAIKSGLQLIPKLLEQDKKDKIITLIETLNTSAVFMERLINDLLDFSKIQEETLSLKPGEIGIKQLLEETITAQRLKAQEKSIELSADIPELDNVLLCDPVRIKQVLNNLVGNALKFTPENGKVKLTVKDANDRFYFSVTDTGPGIAKENLHHLFDRYWQEKKTAFLGTGLGLFISKGIVKAHGGRIWVDSEPGKGSNFQFEIPKNKMVKDDKK